MDNRRVGLYNVVLLDTSGKKDKTVYNNNLPFGMDEGCKTACTEENIRGLMKLFQLKEPYDKIEFKYLRDLIDIER